MPWVAWLPMPTAAPSLGPRSRLLPQPFLGRLAGHLKWRQESRRASRAQPGGASISVREKTRGRHTVMTPSFNPDAGSSKRSSLVTERAFANTGYCRGLRAEEISERKIWECKSWHLSVALYGTPHSQHGSHTSNSSCNGWRRGRARASPVAGLLVQSS